VRPDACPDAFSCLGQTAKFVSGDGAVYRGQFAAHKFQGEGRMKLPDGTKFDGKFDKVGL